MRRGHIFSLIAVLLVASACAFALPARAVAAPGGTSPMDICNDLQDGNLDGSYTAAEWQAFLMDTTVQGYCSVIVPTCSNGPSPSPTMPQCTPPTECASGTTATTGPNGTVTCTPPTSCAEGTTATSGTNGTVTCTPPTTCASGTTATTGANGTVTCSPTTVCATGTTATSTVNGTVVCAPPTTCATGTTAVVNAAGQVVCVTPAAPMTGVLGVKHTQTSTPKPTTSNVAGAKHTQSAPAPRAVAPISTTRGSGTLPFTGMQLTLFLLVGLGLVGTGVLLRLTSRKDESR